MRYRSILFALALLASSPATSQSPAELRDLASNFGLTPEQARHVFALYDAQSSRIAELAAASRVDKRLLRSAALRLGATNPDVGAKDFLRLVEGTAARAAEAQAKIERLESLISALQVGDVRTHALAELQEGRKAFDDGRFEDSWKAFARLEMLRQSDLAGVREAWKESVFAQMDVLALAGRNEEASALAQRAARDVMDQARHDSWGFALADARQWADRGELFLDNAALRRSIVILRTQALPLAPPDVAPHDWAETQNNLGIALMRLGERTGATNLFEQAVTAHRAAVQKISRESALIKWATMTLNLCSALYQLGERREETGLAQEGLNNCQSVFDAMVDLSAISDEAGWKTARKNVGALLLRHGNASDVDNWRDIEGLQWALEEYDRDRNPVEWAIAQSKFADILVLQDDGPISLDTLKAIKHYRLALEVLTRERTPMDWARTQNGLGDALQKLAAYDPRRWSTAEDWPGSVYPSQHDLQEEAATAYRVALEVYQRDQAPLFWAKVHRNLGSVLAQLAEEYDERWDKELAYQRFEESAAAYRAAIEGYRGAGAQRERIKTQVEFGCGLEKFGRYRDGTSYMDDAVVVLEEVAKESPSEPGGGKITDGYTARQCLRNVEGYKERRKQSAIESPTGKP